MAMGRRRPLRNGVAREPDVSCPVCGKHVDQRSPFVALNTQFLRIRPSPIAGVPGRNEGSRILTARLHIPCSNVVAEQLLGFYGSFYRRLQEAVAGGEIDLADYVAGVPPRVIRPGDEGFPDDTPGDVEKA